LNAQANQLAHHLRAQGVGPETLVGICMERSLEMLIGIFGVLKAGAAYVPLDPAYPIDRLAYMLGDSGARFVIGSGMGQMGQMNPIDPIDPISLINPIQPTQPTHNPPPLAGPDNLAYVIYTSGSTGRPKGVGVPHGAICNHMLWQREHLAVTGADRILQKTAFSFDASGTEFYLSLLTGARLILARPGGHQDSAYLVQAMADHQVTILQLVPALLRVLLDEPGFGALTSLRRVICAGEALPAELLERFRALLPGAELHNLYGPTEAAIDVTCWPEQGARGRAIVPIGRPIANTHIYILGADGQPVPPGVPGELHIGGANLARGYLNRPDLSAEKFVPHPFSASPRDAGARLYKTGDLVRYLPDGNIEFLGRMDNQVKLRGFRIELGEIETAITQHPAVREAVVLAVGMGAEDTRLVAYLVMADGASNLPVQEWRGFLKEKLPDYMIPALFVTLDALPLTPNGKVDRRALPAPEQTRPDLASAYVAPRTPTEEKLVEIAARILRVERVGVADNFFELGGHSLLATQLLSRLRDAFAVELPLRIIFEGPTIAELAEAIEKAGESGATASVPAMKAIPRETRQMKSSALTEPDSQAIRQGIKAGE
jgi:amino acid adenylation domain-containing protein